MSASNAVTNNEAALDAERQLERALIRLLDLNDDKIAAVLDHQREHDVSFAAAAITLGLATQEDADAAWASSRKIVPIERRPLKSGPQLILAHDPFHPHSEKIRALRTELLLRHENGNRANAMAIVSPKPREGRSVLAAELAISFAQLGKPTLLVDADLRHPSQHLLFGADNQHGLSQAITSSDAPHIHPVEGVANLGVLTAGAAPDNPLELLSDGRLETLVRSWRRRYDHVIIDTAPVSEYADALAVSTVVGRVVVLGRAQHTPYNATRDMLRRLAATQSQILGAVINHF